MKTSIEIRQCLPHLWSRLNTMRQTGRIAHAYLITGDDEELLEATAREWGRAIACTDPREGCPCGSCTPCQSFGHGTYREWYELRPKSRSRHILVDEMREFEHQLGLTPAPGCRKLGVIIEADRLNIQAQNAFLKTLEEPPGALVLLLVTTNARALLPTIRSRCQQIPLRRNRKHFGLLEHIDLVDALKTMRRNAGAAQALQVAAKLQRAFAMLMQIAEAQEPELTEDVAAFADQDASLKKRLVDQRAARVQSEYTGLRMQLCAAIETWFQQRCLILTGRPAGKTVNPELTPEPKDVADVTPLDAFADMQEAAKLTRFMAGNVDEALAIEAFCLTVCRKTA